MITPAGKFLHTSDLDIPQGWFHVVMQHVEPGGINEALVIYHNGTEVSKKQGVDVAVLGQGAGVVVVGRYQSDLDTDYAGVEVDELLMFVASLNTDQIKVIYEWQQ